MSLAEAGQWWLFSSALSSCCVFFQLPVFGLDFFVWFFFQHDLEEDSLTGHVTRWGGVDFVVLHVAQHRPVLLIFLMASSGV